VLIGADLGTTHCTVLAIEPDGNQVAVSREALGTRTLEPGWADQDAREWWDAFVRAARACIAGLDGRPVIGLGVASHLEAWVPLEAGGEPLHPGLLWLDLRTSALAESVAERLRGHRVFERTGVTPDYLSPAVKIAWIREALGRIWSRTARLLSPKDVLVYRLTGRATTDRTIASKTMLYDSVVGAWADDILDAMGIPAALLPPVLESTETVGRVTAQAAAVTGLPSGLPVVAGGGDDHTQALAGGAIDAGDVSVNTGTSSCLKIVTERFDPRLNGLAECHGYVVPGRWLYWLPMGPTGYFVDWFLSVTGDKGMSEVSPDERVAMDRSAAKAPAGSDGLMFLPYAWGARLPKPDQSATGGFVGIRSVHGHPHFARAVLEGVAYQYAYARRLLRKLPIQGGNVMTILGGEARSSLWTQIKSDVTGCVVEVPGAPEASAFGAALLAGVGAEVFQDIEDAVRRAVRIAARFEPGREDRPRYEALFEEYDATVHRLFPDWPAPDCDERSDSQAGEPQPLNRSAGHGQTVSRASGPQAAQGLTSDSSESYGWRTWRRP
jgi:xylulokinase